MAGLNNGKVTTAVLLDIRAAFDTVWHHGLLHKLMNLGLSPLLCKIIKSFLDGRSMSVAMNGVSSRRQIIRAGVPQGSCVSDILFLAYINDMPSHPGIKKSQFADDSLFYRTHKDCKLATKTFNSFLGRVSDYFKCWKLVICEKKSQMLNIIGRCSDTSRQLRSNAKKMNVHINGKNVEVVDSLRYLGQWFNKNAAAVCHIDKAICKANVATSKLRHLLRSNKISCNIKNMFYKSIIRPILCYASPIWANPSTTSSAQMERIRLAERKLLRSTTNTKRERGSFMYVNSSTLYRKAKTARIDRFITNKALDFIKRCAESDDPTIQSIADFHAGEDSKYLPVAFWSKWRSENIITDSALPLTIFNRSSRGPHRNVYNLNQ